MQAGHSLQPSLCGKNIQAVTKEASARSDEDSLSEEGTLPGRARHPAEHSSALQTAGGVHKIQHTLDHPPCHRHS